MMLRDEAIELLCAYGVPQDEDKFREALNMAIQALKQEPCEDCVSRQAVKEAIMECEEPCDYRQAFYIDDTTDLEIKIKELPSVQPKPTLFIQNKDVDPDELEKLFAENQPLIYAEPVRKKGKWIKGNTKSKIDYMGDRVEAANYSCSLCGRIICDVGTDPLTNHIEDYPYCHCGAEMESEGEE